MKCSNIEAMSGKSKLAKMAWSGSLTLAFVPRFINNDYVTAEITYSPAHARHQVLTWTRTTCDMSST